MSNELKRVGLVFTQEGAVDFKKTLQEVNLELNKNYNQFKLTQAQWDSSTKSTEKLRAEQEYLKNAYEIQADKVSTLKMQLSDLENAEDKNTTAIKKKRNELTNAEVKLETYNKRLKEIENQLTNTGKKIEEFGTKVENIGNKIEGAGKKLSAFSLATGTALATSAKSAIDFEDAFTGVEKTVDGTEEQMAELKQGIRDMAKEIPSTTTEISAVAEAAGQLGIKTEDILSFTRVMIDLGNSTNLSAEEAASSLAKFANVTKMSAKDYDKLGATIVALGNNFATTEADIVEMATRLAATGELAGLSESQILSLATAMSSVGIEAEAGGSAMSKLLKQIQVACETGSDDLKDFAKVAGMSADDFKKAFEKDAVSALTAFISGLNDTERNGKSAISILNDMGIKEVRLSNTILSLANASDVMTEAVELGSEAWEDNTALTNEANKRYGTLKSQITIAMNKIKDLGITIGNKLMPHISNLIKGIENATNWFANLSDEQVNTIIKIGALVTAIGPLLTMAGKLTSTIGSGIKTLGTFTQAIGVMNGTVTTSSTAVNGLASIIGGLTSPTGLAITSITLLAGAITYFATKQTEAQKEAKEFADEMKNSKESLEEYNKKIDETTNSNLAEINSVNELKDELSTLVDENGKVKESYKGRVSFILNQLNKALGTEYKLNGNVIQNYKDLQTEIGKTIEKKKAEITLNAEEEKYKNAIEKQAEAVEKLKEAQEKLGMSYDEVREKYGKYIDKINNNTLTVGDVEEIGSTAEYKKIKELATLSKAYEDAEWQVKEYTTEVKKYEEDYALFSEGKYNEIGNSITNTTKQWCDTTLQEIGNSIKEQQEALEIYKQIYENTGNEVALKNAEQAQTNLDELAKELTERTSTIGELGADEIEAWQSMATNSYSTYFDTISKMEPTLAEKIQGMIGITAEMTPGLVEETSKMSQQVIDQINKNPEFKAKALENLRGYLSGLEDSTLRELLKEAGIENADKVIEGIKNGNLAEDQGMQILNSLNTGLQNKSWKQSLFSTARGIASSLSGILTVKANVNGNTSALPGHKLGLDYVPKDNYVARLHKGERVLTKEENEAYSEAEKRTEKNNSSSIFNQSIDYDKMANSMLRALTGCKFTLDEDGFAKIVKDELYKVV